jgi:hypothetical protein
MVRIHNLAGTLKRDSTNSSVNLDRLVIDSSAKIHPLTTNQIMKAHTWNILKEHVHEGIYFFETDDSLCWC